MMGGGWLHEFFTLSPDMRDFLPVGRMRINLISSVFFVLFFLEYVVYV